MPAHDSTLNVIHGFILSFFKPTLEAFNCIYILKIFQLTYKFTYGFTKVIPLNISITYSKDRNFKMKLLFIFQ